jgi:hypothetical protein
MLDQRSAIELPDDPDLYTKSRATEPAVICLLRRLGLLAQVS